MPPSRAAHRPDLEALRGLAVLLVVLYHAGVAALAGGFVGVDVFFVLSGFFAARLFVREYAATGTLDVAGFYARRAVRLLPPLLVVVAATLALVHTFWAPIDRAAVAGTARDVALGRANVAFAEGAVDYFGNATSPFLHTWSLAVELQLSLVAPLVFLALVTLGAWTAGRRPAGGGAVLESDRRVAGLLRGVGFGLLAIAVASFTHGVWLAGAEPSQAYFSSLGRAWEFAVGGLLALVVPPDGDGESARPAPAGGHRWLPALGLLAIGVGAVAYRGSMPYPGVAALLPVLGAAVVIAGGAGGHGVLAGDGPVRRALRWLGRIAYAWYLWHWPLMMLGVVLDPWIGPLGRLGWAAAALLPAWATLRWVEAPARGAGSGPATSAGWRLAVALGLCVVVALGAGAVRRAAEQRVREPDQRAFAAARVDRMRHECWGVDPAVAARSCAFGDPRATTTVALFGDSHAEHWLAALDRLGRERGWRVVPFVKGGCPVSDAPELVAARAGRWGQECARWRAGVVAQLATLRPAAAVLSSWDGYIRRGDVGRASDDLIPPAAWGRGLERTYARVAAAGVPVLAMRDVPHPDFDGPACLSRAAAGLPAAGSCTFQRDDRVHVAARQVQGAAARRVAARGLPIALVDMSDRVCPTVQCGVARGGLVVYTDDDHLTARFARSMAPALGARLDAAVATLGRRLP